MIVWHVCSYARLSRYLATGAIMPPVRAWEDYAEAARMSVSRGSRLIIRLRFPNDAARLPGHRGKARVVFQPVRLKRGEL